MKNPLKSKTVEGGAFLAVIVLLRSILSYLGIEITDTELYMAAEGVGAVAGFAWLVWGRRTAREPISLNPLYRDRGGDGKFPISLGIVVVGTVLLVMTLGMPGCRHYDNLSDRQRELVVDGLKAISKSAAFAVMNLALDKAGDSVRELRPYIPGLKQTVQVAFTLQPPEAADLIAGALAELPPEHRQFVLQALRAALEDSGTVMEPGTTASPVEIYGNRLLHALPRR